VHREKSGWHANGVELAGSRRVVESLLPQLELCSANTRHEQCDGGAPACSNCAKADEVCFDVDGQNADILIPRK